MYLCILVYVCLCMYVLYLFFCNDPNLRAWINGTCNPKSTYACMCVSELWECICMTFIHTYIHTQECRRIHTENNDKWSICCGQKGHLCVANIATALSSNIEVRIESQYTHTSLHACAHMYICTLASMSRSTKQLWSNIVTNVRTYTNTYTLRINILCS